MPVRTVFERVMGLAWWVPLLAVSFFSACSVRADPVRLHVFAAASLVDIMGEIATRFEQETGVEVGVVTAGSATLAQQIVAGAPADIFVSANRQWVDYVVEQAGFDPGFAIFANQLALVSSDPAFPVLTSLKALPDALKSGRLALGDPCCVPAGIYAKQALEAAGVWEAVADRLAPAGDVRAALRLVAAGAVPLGIVYRTDVRRSNLHIVLKIQPDLHQPILYFVSRALTVRTDQERGAMTLFMRFLQEPDIKALAASYGYLAPKEAGW